MLPTPALGQYGMAIHEMRLVSAAGSKIQTWDLRKVAQEIMTPEQVSGIGAAD